jgi:signal peptidase I
LSEDQVIEHDAREALPTVTTEDGPAAVPGDSAQPPPQLVQSVPVWGEVRALVRDLIFAALTAVLLVVFVAQPVKVEGTSMLPRLHDGERIFVNKFLYSLDGWPSERFSIGRKVERGDIVVFWYPTDPSKSFIKRVIGLPGDTVEVDTDGKVLINGEPLDESYLSPDWTKFPQRKIVKVVRPHRYFVMGDNRDHSNDSRQWGQVPEKYIYGQAWFRYWPLDEMGVLEH